MMIGEAPQRPLRAVPLRQAARRIRSGRVRLQRRSRCAAEPRRARL